MDSPVFGKPVSHFRRSQQQISPPSAEVQSSLAVLLLTKNIHRLLHAIRRIQLKSKKACFDKLHDPETDSVKPFVGQRQLICLLETKRRVSSIVHIVSNARTKMKLGAWQQMKTKVALQLEEERRSNTQTRNRDKHKERKTDEWKENSTYNILDLSGENRRLKLQISREQTEEETFIEKMNALLDMHEKSKGNLKKRK